MFPILEISYNVLAPIFAIVGLSILVGWRLNPSPRALSQLVVYLFTPCLVLNSLARSTLQVEEIGRIALLVLLQCLLLGLLAWGTTRLLALDRPAESAFLLSVIVMNSGNYGLPASEFAFGQAGLERAVVFFVIMSMVSNTVGVYLASRGSASVLRSLANVATVPLFYAALIGLLLNRETIVLPLALQRAINLLAQAAVPCMLVILGLQLSRISIGGRWLGIGLATATRLVVAPLLAILLVGLLGFTGLTRQVVILQASMPTAVITSVLATEFGADAQFATAVVAVTTLGSIVSLSLLLHFIG